MRNDPPKVQLHPFASDEALVTGVAQRWCEAIRSHSIQTVALSGGRIAAQLFRAVVQETRGRIDAWSRVHCFWADERCVDPEDAESNYRLAKHELLDPLRWPSDHVHRLRGELPAAEAARRGEGELLKVTGPSGQLDLILLGMGEDGHVASLFPGQPWLAEHDRDRFYWAVRGPKPPQERVTLSFQAITRAAHAWLVVSGSGKETALNRALSGDRTLPLGRVIASRKSTQIFSSVTLTDS